MSAATNVIKASLDLAAFCVNAYLQDLSDEQLLIRPAEGCNHIAWQLGHLVVAEHKLTNQVCPDTMPALPDGFAERYTKETAKLDDAAAFHSKDEYVKLLAEQRAGTLAALSELTDEELQRPAPEEIREHAPTVAATFAMQATHCMMHSGQWVVVRRKLGRAPLF
jgi:uncharacterized damage-inducible protein DinB